MTSWLKYASIDLDSYNLKEDISDSSWHYLFNDIKEEYATYKGWDKDEGGEDLLWDEDNDKLYEAEEAAYQVIAEIREERGYN